MVKKLEKEKEDIEMLAKGKIPYYIKLREATIRDMKLTPEQKNLVLIRNKFDEIRKHESELNGWICKIKRKASPERCRTTNNFVFSSPTSPLSKLNRSPIKRRTSIRKASNMKMNEHLSMLVHKNMDILSKNIENKSARKKSRFSTKFSQLMNEKKLNETSSNKVYSNYIENQSPIATRKCKKVIILDNDRHIRERFILDVQSKFKTSKMISSLQKRSLLNRRSQCFRINIDNEKLISSTISKLKFISASYLMKAVASDKLKKEYKIKSSLMDWLISMISLGKFYLIKDDPRMKILMQDEIVKVIVKDLNNLKIDDETRDSTIKSPKSPQNKSISIEVDNYTIVNEKVSSFCNSKRIKLLL